MKRQKISRKTRKKNEKFRRRGEEGGRWVRIVQVASIVAILAILVGVINLNKPPVDSGSRNYEGSTPLVDESKAVLVDGIAFTDPNPKFTRSVKEILSKANITLDIYDGEEVTINLLRKIGGYGLIILRLHSAIDERSRLLYIFSAEKFDSEEYELRYGENSLEYKLRAVRKGITFRNESYFALRADLLGDLSDKGLNGSIVILMGCNGTNSQQIISNLFRRGVKAVIAWDGYVDLNHTDEITVELLKAVYEEHMDFCEAVEKVMDDGGADPLWKSKLECLTNSGG